MKTAKLEPRPRFHDLRHAYASALLTANVHPKIVSEALGHASVAFTLDTYSHVIPSLGQQAADAIQAAIGVQRTALGGES